MRLLRALLAVAPVVLLAACESGGTDPEPVASVVVTPGSTELRIDEDVTLEAEVRDAGGDVLDGRTVTWSTSDEAVATVSAAGVVTGTGEGTATITATSEERSGSASVTVVPNIAEETVVVDETQFELVSTAEEREAGEFRFLTSDPAPFAVGDVIVGTQGGGYLRRVESIAVEGDTLVVTTAFADLSEAVVAGGFQSTVQMSLEDAEPVSRNGVQWGAARLDYLAPGVRPSEAGFVLEGTLLLDQEVCRMQGGAEVCGNLRVDLPRGEVEFAPILDAGATFSLFGGLQEFHAVADGTLSFDVDVRAQAEVSATSSGDLTIASVSRPFSALVGPVPVAGVATMELVVGHELDLEVEGTIQSGAMGSHSVSVGARYEGNGWSDVFDQEQTFESRPFTWDAGADAAVRVEVKPVMTVEFYGVVGPTVTGIPYLDFDGSVDVDQCTWQGTVDAGLDLELAVRLEILSRTLAGRDRTLTGQATRLLDVTGAVVNNLAVVSGNGQTGAPDATLSAPLTVVVTDANGAPKAGTPVAFEVTGGSGSVGESTVVTDAQGRASTTWRLGSELEGQRVTATTSCGAGGVVFDVNVQAGSGDLSGRVVDAVTGEGLAGATVTESRALAAGSSPAGAPATVTTSSDGRFTISDLAVGSWNLTATRDGYVPVTLYGAEVRADQTVQIETFLLVPDNPNPGGISGRVIDAVDASAIVGATVELREGQNASNTTVVAQTTSGSDGSYSFQTLPAGTYTVAGSATGYTDGARTGIVVGETEVSGQDVVLSPEDGTGGGVYRVVLTWGQTPHDLDSHLTGPLEDGSRFHVAWFSRGTLDGPPYAELDVDDVSSFGPETITFIPMTEGLFRYSVHDFTNRSSTSSTGLANSGARVEVFRGGVLVERFFVPGGGGTLWTVFELQDGQIVPINGMSYVSSPFDVTVPPRHDDDSDVIDLDRVKKPGGGN